MALEIKPPPVLEGKAARDFLKKVRNFKDDTDPEYVKESVRRTRAFLEEQERLHPRKIW
jgi:hypothetical protein